MLAKRATILDHDLATRARDFRDGDPDGAGGALGAWSFHRLLIPILFRTLAVEELSGEWVCNRLFMGNNRAAI